MNSLATIKRVNREAVINHDKKIAREATLRNLLKDKLPAKKLASYSLDDLEKAALYLL
jgi:hypothetical protein